MVILRYRVLEGAGAAVGVSWRRRAAVGCEVVTEGGQQFGQGGGVIAEGGGVEVSQVIPGHDQQPCRLGVQRAVEILGDHAGLGAVPDQMRVARPGDQVVRVILGDSHFRAHFRPASFMNGAGFRIPYSVFPIS
jgi:hypothetical protein